MKLLKPDRVTGVKGRGIPDGSRGQSRKLVKVFKFSPVVIILPSVKVIPPSLKLFLPSKTTFVVSIETILKAFYSHHLTFVGIAQGLDRMVFCTRGLLEPIL